MSLSGFERLWITAGVLAGAALPGLGQYPGQITKPDKNAPTLRAVAVLEWTGDETHPKASRLIPVTVFDGQELEDGSVYMARPEPLALEGEVEYQLQQDGKPVGLFDIQNSGREQGSWVGFGKWKPLPRPRPVTAQVAKIDEDDAQSDTPVLHRKHGAGDVGGSGSDSGSGAGSAPPDPDRPTLHKGGDASSGDSSGGGDSGSGSGSDGGSGSAHASDPDRPTLHKGGDASGGDSAGSGTSSGSSTSASTTASNSDRPKLKKKSSEDEGYVEDVASVTDPDRPHLGRGKTEGFSGSVLPSLMGIPADMQQEVAVSDLKSRPVHPWGYSWANPDDEAKMKEQLEDIARTLLGLGQPAAPAKPAAKTAKTVTPTHKITKPASPPVPASLGDEQFRVFELAYGSGATMVLSAHTDGSNGPMKFVTLVAQPDLYGNVAVLVKNVTDAAHLDDAPRMRLVDAVDAMADNRGELLFELRGASQRQFALYRVLRGQATRIFVSGGDAIGTPTGE